jgi:hypothetical protein
MLRLRLSRGLPPPPLLTSLLHLDCKGGPLVRQQKTRFFQCRVFKVRRQINALSSVGMTFLRTSGHRTYPFDHPV